MIKEARDRHYPIYICRPSEGSDLENIYGKETIVPFSEQKDDSPSIRMICDKMAFPFRGAVQKRCQAR
jgi:hypothetical protein